MAALCKLMGIKEEESLYTTAQGKKWWGDQSTPNFLSGEKEAFDHSLLTRLVGDIFSLSDQFVLGTLFYPFSVRFSYAGRSNTIPTKS